MKKSYTCLAVIFLLLALMLITGKPDCGREASLQELETIGRSDIKGNLEFIEWNTAIDTCVVLDSSNNVHIRWPGIPVYIECENVKVVWDTLRSEDK